MIECNSFANKQSWNSFIWLEISRTDTNNLKLEHGLDVVFVISENYCNSSHNIWDVWGVSLTYVRISICFRFFKAMHLMTKPKSFGYVTVNLKND